MASTAQQIAALQSQAAALKTALATETTARKSEDSAIRVQIAGLQKQIDKLSAPAPVPVPTPTPVPPPPPANTDFASLQQQGLLPSYAAAADPGDYSGVVPYPGTVVLYMPQTGGRPDLDDPLTGWGARAVINGSASNAAKQTVINADAEALFAWHIDGPNGAPWNIDTHPDVSIYPHYGETYLVSDPNSSTMPGTIDDAHQPQLQYLAYFLASTNAEREKRVRAAQYQANWHMLSHGTFNGTGLLINSQLRGIAHTLLSIAHAAVITRLFEETGVTPSKPLLSSNYFYRKVENNLRWLGDLTVKSISPPVQGLRLFGFDPTAVALWQNSKVLIVLGWLARLGFSRAKPIFDWGVVGSKAQFNTLKSDPSGYWLDCYDDATKKVATTYTEVAALNGILTTGPISPAVNWDYVQNLRAVLCIAASFGDAEASQMAAALRSGMPAWAPDVSYAFDWTPRPIVATQPTVSSDPQFTPFLVSDSAMIVQADAQGRAYAATAPGQTVKAWGDFWSDRAAIWTSNGYASVGNSHSGGGFSTNRDFVAFPDGKIFNVKNGAWAP